MPNWCSNVVTIYHNDKKLIDELETELIKNNDNCKPFTLLRPMPEGSDDGAGDSWYNWNVNNWGTKWEPSVGDVTRVDENTLTVIMETAWSPPVSLYQYMESDLGYSIDAYYEECGMAFCGHYEDGFDDYYEYGDMSADDMEANLPEKLLEHFGLADRKRDEEDEEEWDDDYPDEDEGEFSNFEDSERSDWFPKKVPPIYLGIYEIRTDAWPFPQKARWDGKKWYLKDIDINDYDLEVKISEWRGLAQSPI